jgi:hypothetical protein
LPATSCSSSRTSLPHAARNQAYSVSLTATRVSWRMADHPNRLAPALRRRAAFPDRERLVPEQLRRAARCRSVVRRGVVCSVVRRGVVRRGVVRRGVVRRGVVAQIRAARSRARVRGVRCRAQIRAARCRAARKSCAVSCGAVSCRRAPPCARPCRAHASVAQCNPCVATTSFQRPPDFFSTSVPKRGRTSNSDCADAGWWLLARLAPHADARARDTARPRQRHAWRETHIAFYRPRCPTLSRTAVRSARLSLAAPPSTSAARTTAEVAERPRLATWREAEDRPEESHRFAARPAAAEELLLSGARIARVGKR